MYDFIYGLSHYAPLVIFVAATLDIFFISGYILYGGATLGAIGMMHMSGMISIPEILIAALLGTLTGNQLNYWAGRLFRHSAFIERRLKTPRGEKAERFLRTRGLLPFMVIGRFVTFFRPIHGVILGSFNIRIARVLIYDAVLSFLWVSFWLTIILYGEKIYLHFFA